MIQWCFHNLYREIELKQKVATLNSTPLNTIEEPIDDSAVASRWSTAASQSLSEDRQDSSGMGGAVYDERDIDESFVIGLDLTSNSINDSSFDLDSGVHASLQRTSAGTDTFQSSRSGKFSPATKKRSGLSPMSSGEMLVSGSSQSDLSSLTLQPSLGSLISRSRESEADFSK